MTPDETKQARALQRFYEIAGRDPDEIIPPPPDETPTRKRIRVLEVVLQRFAAYCDAGLMEPNEEAGYIKLLEELGRRLAEAQTIANHDAST